MRFPLWAMRAAQRTRELREGVAARASDAVCWARAISRKISVAIANPVPVSGLVRELERILPRDAVLSEREDVKPYECDGLSAYRQTPMIVVLPADEAHVRQILALCHRQRVPVVARGAGQACPAARPRLRTAS